MIQKCEVLISINVALYSVSVNVKYTLITINGFNQLPSVFDQIKS